MAAVVDVERTVTGRALPESYSPLSVRVSLFEPDFDIGNVEAAGRWWPAAAVLLGSRSRHRREAADVHDAAARKIPAPELATPAAGTVKIGACGGKKVSREAGADLAIVLPRCSCWRAA